MTRPVHATGRWQSTTESSVSHAFVTGAGTVEDRRGVPPHSTDWGQPVDAGRLPKGTVRRWKAPRVRLSALSFAGERVRRPYPVRVRGSGPRDAPARERRTARQARSGRQNRLPTTPTSPGGGSSRACDMRCSSRSGWGEAFTASGRGGRSRRWGTASRTAPGP
jgi:hypothetical protein